MKKLAGLCIVLLAQTVLAQNIGFNTTTPQANSDVRGNLQVSSAGNPGLYNNTVICPVIGDNNIVNNVSYAYLLEAFVFGSAFTWPANGDLKRVVIEYTVAEAE